MIPFEDEVSVGPLDEKMKLYVCRIEPFPKMINVGGLSIANLV